jgi:hypothetical protein
MPAKYSEGTVVRFKIIDPSGQPPLQALDRYENQTGKVLSSNAIVAYMWRSIATEALDSPAMTIYTYTIELEDGITLSDVTEFQLEAI